MRSFRSAFALTRLSSFVGGPLVGKSNLLPTGSTVSTQSLKRSNAKSCEILESLTRTFSSTAVHDRVYELRIYDLKPDSMTDFMKLSNEHFHLRTAHSKLVGYWLTDIGGINQAVHIWEYDSFSHRTSVRANLSKDPVWVGTYVSKLVTSLAKQDNVALTLLPWSEIEVPATEGGIYELCAHTLLGSETKWGPKMQDMLVGKEQSHQGTLLGAWKAQAGGPMNTIYHLWHYPSLDNRIQSSVDAAQDPDYVLTKEELLPFCAAFWSKILTGAPWSPMK